VTAISVAQSPAIVAPLTQRPASAAPASLGRTWSISTTGGFTLTGYLPPWADEDPSDTGVPLERLSVTLIDLAHRRPFAGQRMRVHHPARAGDDGQAGESEESLFDGHITCYPYSEDPRVSPAPSRYETPASAAPDRTGVGGITSHRRQLEVAHRDCASCSAGREGAGTRVRGDHRSVIVHLRRGPPGQRHR
jgi:hypothetical protein